jgi:hypothetical protein
LRLLAAVALAVVLVSGCALNRIYAAKEQFCDFEENFTYTLGDEPALVFQHPVIRASDVERLIRFGPSSVLPEQGEIVHRYEVEKVQIDGTGERVWALDLGYAAIDGKLHLKSVSLPYGRSQFETLEGIEPINEHEALARAAVEICQARPRLTLGPVEEQLDPRQLERLPSREELLAMAGEPSWISTEDGAMIYAYQVVGATLEEGGLSVMVWFDDSGEKPARVVTSFRGMRSDANLEQGVVRFSRGG